MQQEITKLEQLKQDLETKLKESEEDRQKLQSKLWWMSAL